MSEDFKVTVAKRIAAGEAELAEQKKKLDAINAASPQIAGRIQQLLGALAELREIARLSDLAVKDPQPEVAEK